VTNIVKTLDEMYSGQIVMKQFCDKYGLEWSSWPPDAFESVQRRHEELVAEVRQHITPDVPDGAFFPLGIKSQLLLTGEKVIVDEEALAEMQEHAVGKAERKWQERQREQEAMVLAGAGALFRCPSYIYFVHAGRGAAQPPLLQAGGGTSPSLLGALCRGGALGLSTRSVFACRCPRCTTAFAHGQGREREQSGGVCRPIRGGG
jgi:hypothetical protein